jgi:hypothetical protein
MLTKSPARTKLVTLKIKTATRTRSEVFIEWDPPEAAKRIDVRASRSTSSYRSPEVRLFDARFLPEIRQRKQIDLLEAIW